MNSPRKFSVKKLSLQVLAPLAIIGCVVASYYSARSLTSSIDAKSSVSEIDRLLKRLHPGNAVFNPPASMVYGETRTIELLLDPSKTIDELKGMVVDQGATQGYQIRFSDLMEAKLTGDGFQIIPATPEVQPVSMKETTKWQWDIRPTWFGTQTLHLSLNALLNVNGRDSTRSIETLNRTVSVRVLPTSISVFAKDHWGMVASILGAIGGILAWIFEPWKRARSAAD